MINTAFCPAVENLLLVAGLRLLARRGARGDAVQVGVVRGDFLRRGGAVGHRPDEADARPVVERPPD